MFENTSAHPLPQSTPHHTQIRESKRFKEVLKKEHNKKKTLSIYQQVVRKSYPKTKRLNKQRQKAKQPTT